MLQQLLEYDRQCAGMSMQERSKNLGVALNYIKEHRATEDVTELINELLVRAGELADDIPEVLAFKADALAAAIPLTSGEDRKLCKRVCEKMRQQVEELEGSAKHQFASEQVVQNMPETAPKATLLPKTTPTAQPVPAPQPVPTTQKPVPTLEPVPILEPKPQPAEPVVSKTPLDFLINNDWEEANKKLGILNIIYGLVTTGAWCWGVLNFNLILMVGLTAAAIVVRKVMNDRMLELILIRKTSDQLESERPDYKVAALNVIKCTKSLSWKFWVASIAVAILSFVKSYWGSLVIVVFVINAILCTVLHSRARKKVWKKAENSAEDVFKKKEYYKQKAA